MNLLTTEFEHVKYAFSDAFDRALTSVYKDKTPVAINKHEFVIGDLEIRYNNGLYSVVDKFSKAVVYKDIYIIEAAFLLAKYNQLHLSNSVKSILILEQQYTKHYLDMQSHANAYNVAKKKEEYDKMEIAETRYACSKLNVVSVRNKLKIMCNKIIRKR